MNGAIAAGFLLISALLAGCGKDLGEDAAAVAGTGIPVGAQGAVGPSYDAPVVVRTEDGVKKPNLPPVPKLPHQMPPDPFGGNSQGDGGSSPPPKKKGGGVAL